MEIIVGTAGHIDHGKTALVRALTGTDTDRLPEEKRRGITVDLGFAEMNLGDMHFGFVDVPGHERFVKNMLAGASGIDIVLLVVAADEGVMPQTREHFDICRLLDIKSGIVALTKSDLVDQETEELARLEILELVSGSFLHDAPILNVSSRTGDGIESLKASLISVSEQVARGRNDIVTRLPIDRSFSIKGFGAVVTGTLASGEIVNGREMEALPPRTKVRVRGLQTHGQSVGDASVGQRVAVNLGGIDHSRLERGMVLTEVGALEPTQIFDANVEVLASASRPLRSRQRVRLHIGTIEALARVQVLNEQNSIEGSNADLVQVRLEAPVIAVPGERFIIRSYSPQATIAGGQVIDPLASRHRRRDLDHVRAGLTSLMSANGDNARAVEILIGWSEVTGMTLEQLARRTGLNQAALDAATRSSILGGSIVDTGSVLVSKARFETLVEELIKALELLHKKNPLAAGFSRVALRDELAAHTGPEIFQAVLNHNMSAGKVSVDKDLVRLTAHQSQLSAADEALKNYILSRYDTAGLEVPRIDEVLDSAPSAPPQLARRILQMLVGTGEVVKGNDEFYFSRNAIDALVERLRKQVQVTNDRVIDVPKFKEIAGVSRKYAIPILEYLDREHITARAGDKRVIL